MKFSGLLYGWSCLKVLYTSYDKEECGTKNITSQPYLAHACPVAVSILRMRSTKTNTIF